MSQTGRKRKSNPGFTLIELVLTTLIIAILVGVSAPLFRNQFSDLELRNSCYNITKLVSFAQQRAIAEARFFRINFDFERRTYWLSSGDDPKKFERVKGKYGRKYSLPSQVRVRSGKSSFLFYPNGTGEKINITLVGRGSSYKLESKGMLGHVEIRKITER